MKICSKCKIAKEPSNFAKRSAAEDGLGYECRECVKARMTVYNAKIRAERADELKRAGQEYRRANKERLKAVQKAYIEKNAERVKARKRAWYLANRERCAEQSRQRNQKLPAEKKQAYALAAKERRLVKPSIGQAAVMKRRADQLRRTPVWADHDAIKAIYAGARLIRQQGIDAHVDHIYPLRGKLVCGLHVEANLAIVMGDYNRRKNAKAVDPDSEEFRLAVNEVCVELCTDRELLLLYTPAQPNPGP